MFWILFKCVKHRVAFSIDWIFTLDGAIHWHVQWSLFRYVFLLWKRQRERERRRREKNITTTNNTKKITAAYYRIIGCECSWTFFEMAFKQKKIHTFFYDTVWYIPPSQPSIYMWKKRHCRAFFNGKNGAHLDCIALSAVFVWWPYV